MVKIITRRRETYQNMKPANLHDPTLDCRELPSIHSPLAVAITIKSMTVKLASKLTRSMLVRYIFEGAFIMERGLGWRNMMARREELMSRAATISIETNTAMAGPLIEGLMVKFSFSNKICCSSSMLDNDDDELLFWAQLIVICLCYHSQLLWCKTNSNHTLWEAKNVIKHHSCKW